MRESRPMGRPKKPEGPMVDVTMKMPQALKDSLPRTTKGGVDWDWVRDTLRAGVESGAGTVAVLQVKADGPWPVVGVFATKELADIEASRAGYVESAVSEFGVRRA